MLLKLLKNFLDAKYIIKVYFKPRRKNPDSPSEPVCLKINHLVAYIELLKM